MRHLQWILPAFALGGAAVLLAPGASRGYVLLGGALDLSQRDFRVWNNFGDPEANDNGVHDPDFPGSTGAVLAIRKAVAEWGSELHGTGTTDPTQPDGLGSGGANFDSSFQGERAPGPNGGGPDSNLFAELQGFNGLVKAFTELPISDGWRIRFFSDPYVWNDGPGPVESNGQFQLDLQGVATHEYGHALGLDHSTVPGATMFSAAPNHGVDLRSIEDDDRAGLQALYGVKAPDKPRITGYHVSPSSLVVEGEHFADHGNEVWFTPRFPSDGSSIVKATGLRASDGGTRIEVRVPDRAGAGDLLVKVPGQAYADLSNAFPYDPAGDPCRAPETYGVPKTSSAGVDPILVWEGLPSAAVSAMSIGTDGGIPGAMGFLLSGTTTAARPLGGGTLWVGGALRRVAAFAFEPDGSVRIPVAVSPALVGTTRHFQIWFVDAADPQGVGLSDALTVTFCP